MTVLKHADDKQPQIDALNALLARPDVDARTRKQIDDVLWSKRLGIKGEREAAYAIDFEYASRKSYVVIHDLRLEFEGRVAQIDHLIISRILDIWLCETKFFSEGVRVTDQGHWERYGGGRTHGAESPIKQNERHVAVVRDVIDKGGIKLPGRLFTFKPRLVPVVLISNEAKLHLPKTKAARGAIDGLSSVIKVEQLVERIERTFDERNALVALARAVSVSADDLVRLGEQFVALHRPAPIDGPERFGLPPSAVSAGPKVASAVAGTQHRCASCGAVVPDKVAQYSLDHPEKFGGEVFCWDCQHSRARRQARAQA